MPMTTEQANAILIKKIGQFTGALKENVRFENQQLPNGKPFVAPTDKVWCKVFIEYGDSQLASIGNSPCVRDFGLISIQCFAPLNSGTKAMDKLCDAWRLFFQSFTDTHLEVYKVNAPQSIQDKDFYAKIVRAEFRVN
jgi:hypothetical protein